LQRGISIAGQSHEHERRRPLQIVRQSSESGLAIHVESGPAIEFENPIAPDSGDRQQFGGWAARLGDSNPNGTAAQHDSRDGLGFERPANPLHGRIRERIGGTRPHDMSGAQSGFEAANECHRIQARVRQNHDEVFASRPTGDPRGDLATDLGFVAADIRNQEWFGFDATERQDAHRRLAFTLDSRAEYAVGRGSDNRRGPQQIDSSRQQGLYTRRKSRGRKKDCEIGPPHAGQSGCGRLLDGRRAVRPH